MKLDVENLRVRLQGLFDNRLRRVVEPEDRVPAAVLVLFVYRGAEPRLVFTKKTGNVPHHQGQFSFPGGVVERSDGSRVETALREAREEIALDPRDVEVVGVLDDVPTSTSGFVITPVVAFCRRAPELRPDGREIERILEIPLRHLLDPASFREELWERDDRVHPVLFFTYGDDVVWGATARILRMLLDLLAAADAR